MQLSTLRVLAKDRSKSRKMKSGQGSHQKSGARCNTPRDRVDALLAGRTSRDHYALTALRYGRRLVYETTEVGNSIGEPDTRHRHFSTKYRTISVSGDTVGPDVIERVVMT